MTIETIERKFGKYKGKKLTRAKAIKLYCKELCSASDYQSWANCSFLACPLWRFRKGREMQVNAGSFGVRDKLHRSNKLSSETRENEAFPAKNELSTTEMQEKLI